MRAPVSSVDQHPVFDHERSGRGGIVEDTVPARRHGLFWIEQPAEARAVRDLSSIFAWTSEIKRMLTVLVQKLTAR